MTRITLLALTTLIVLVLGYRAAFGVPVHLRYRITIELDTPAGVRRGTAIQEIAVTTPSQAVAPVQRVHRRSGAMRW